MDNDYLTFKANIEQQFREIATSKYVIFGTNSMGQIAADVIDAFGGTVVGFCDNNCAKQGRKFRGGKNICSPQHMLAEENIKVVPATFIERNEKAMSKQALELNANVQIVYKEVFLWAFHCKFSKRMASSEDYLKALFYKRKNSGIQLPNISIIVTDYCNLKCKNCMRMVPYISKPQHLDKDGLIKSAEVLTKAADTINSFNMLGGEPFLYPELGAIIKMTGKLYNAVMIDIVTNGTIIPKEEVLDVIQAYGIRVAISDYGLYPDKVSALLEILEKKRIIYDVYDERQEWHPICMCENRKEDIDALKQRFQTCRGMRECFEIYENHLYACGFASTMSKAKKCFDDREKIDLEKGKLSDIVETLSEWCGTNHYMEVCNYCGFDCTKSVPRGEQL